MPPEQKHLLAAARRKSTDAVAATRAAIRALNDAGLEITFAGVAHQAGVSRQWLYKNEGLRAEIEKHRANQSNRTQIPTTQRASDASLRQRNLLLIEENKRLRRENSELKAELATLIGERRTTLANRALNQSGSDEVSPITP